MWSLLIAGRRIVIVLERAVVWVIAIEPVIDAVRMRILFLTICGPSVGAISTAHRCQPSTQNTVSVVVCR